MRLTSLSAPSMSGTPFAYTYLGASRRITQVTLPNGGKVVNSYDTLARRVTLIVEFRRALKGTEMKTCDLPESPVQPAGRHGRRSTSAASHSPTRTEGRPSAVAPGPNLGIGQSARTVAEPRPNSYFWLALILTGRVASADPTPSAIESDASGRAISCRPPT